MQVPTMEWQHSSQVAHDDIGRRLQVEGCGETLHELDSIVDAVVACDLTRQFDHVVGFECDDLRGAEFARQECVRAGTGTNCEHYVAMLDRAAHRGLVRLP